MEDLIAVVSIVAGAIVGWIVLAWLEERGVMK